MSTAIEEFNRLQDVLAQSQMTCIVTDAAYRLPKKQRGTYFEVDNIYRGIISVTLAKSYGRLVPEENLTSTLFGVVVSIRRFQGHRFQRYDPSLYIDFRRRRMQLQIIPDSMVKKTKQEELKLKELKPTVEQIAQELSYKLT